MAVSTSGDPQITERWCLSNSGVAAVQGIVDPRDIAACIAPGNALFAAATENFTQDNWNIKRFS